MAKIEFADFKNCKMTTDEIINNIKLFRGDDLDDCLKYLYSLLFYTDIKIENKIDLDKIITLYLGYRQGAVATVNVRL